MYRLELNVTTEMVNVDSRKPPPAAKFADASDADIISI